MAVYFVQEDRPSGLIKIGYARNAEKRINTIQTGNPAELKVLCVITGDVKFEKQLQRRFKTFRVPILRYGRKRIIVRGEWFKPEDDLLDYIASLPKYPPDPGPPPPVIPLTRRST